MLKNTFRGKLMGNIDCHNEQHLEHCTCQALQSGHAQAQRESFKQKHEEGLQKIIAHRDNYKTTPNAHVERLAANNMIKPLFSMRRDNDRDGTPNALAWHTLPTRTNNQFLTKNSMRQDTDRDGIPNSIDSHWKNPRLGTFDKKKFMKRFC